MEREDFQQLISLLNKRNQLLLDKERELAERSEELLAQKEELTAAVEQLQQNNTYLKDALHRLKIRNQELDQILYRASHDLRSPITSIKGLLDLFTAEGLTSAQATLHEHMGRQVVQMQQMLNSLSRLSQAAFDRLSSEEVDLRDVVREAIDAVRDHPNFSSVAIESELRGVLTFQTDKPLLVNTLRCLVDNALTYRCPEVQAVVHIEMMLEEHHLTVNVRDNGEGIGEEVQGRIFEMFFRGSAKSLGSGLGLYIAKSCVDRLRGSISFRSVRHDTVFTVRLPPLATDLVQIDAQAF